MGGSEVGNSLSGGRIVVSKVADGGPASKSNGLKAQDVILKVNGTDLSEASHATAVEVIKSASEPLNIVVKRKLVDESLEDCVPQLASTGTQTDLSFAQEVENMDTDSGIHDRYSPRQDLLNPFEKSLDDGTSSSECSRRRLESFCREDADNLRSTSESLPSSENIVSSEQGTLPRISRLTKDGNYANHLDVNSNCPLVEQPYVTAFSDEIYFDPEFDYEYEEITLWIANSELGLTFCCGEEDESTVHVCEIDPGSVAYLDGRMTQWDEVLKINDVPVTHISDIEPLVYESVTTIKFLVARPAQEVQATLLGSEGSHDWSFLDPIDADLSNFTIDVIKEEDEDGADKLDGYQKCEKDSGVGRTNDESSEQDVGEEGSTLPNMDKISEESGEKRPAKDDLSACESKSSSGSSRSKEETAFSPKRSRDVNAGNSRNNSTPTVEKESSRRKKEKSSESSNSKKHSGSSSRNCFSPTRNSESSPRKDKERSSDRKKTRNSHRDNHGDESRGERDRERSRHSDQKRNSKLVNVSRTIRASYIKAVNKDSTHHINWIGESDVFGGKLENHDQRSKKKSSLDDNQSLNGSQQNIEWKVRMSKDGSQIFVRKRPVTAARQARNKLLRERAQKITEERKGMTTEDDCQTVYQGRYWPREDRRRHLERVREARRKKMQKLQQIKESESPHTCSGSESGKGRRDIIVEMSHRRMNKIKQKQFDDFTTVREYLTQRNPDGSPVGPVHVTTV
ncbi:E3 ubiquitin-protein ligase PDZRN3-like isoform X1 [Acropora muricata]|uniref:E3 ubiquitin-protein ligase PDZRN3-like isoform X1 n=2 Tax=Acropora muricata TaxID=159855 RepID=UPI0034E47AC5